MILISGHLQGETAGNSDEFFYGAHRSRWNWKSKRIKIL